MKPRLISVLALAWCLSAACLSLAYAADDAVEDFVCPVDGKAFTQTLPDAGKAAGYMLDMQPYGAVVSPLPLPVCPGNGFVIYKDKFSAAEIDALLPLLESPDFQNHSAHYRAFLMMRQLKEPLPQQLRMVQEASWSGPDSYRQQALLLLEQILRSSSLSVRARLDYMLLKAEFERRLGQFDQANATLQTLETLKPASLKYFVGIIQCQRRLIDAKNRKTAPTPNERTSCGQNININ